MQMVSCSLLLISVYSSHMIEKKPPLISNTRSRMKWFATMAIISFWISCEVYLSTFLSNHFKRRGWSFPLSFCAVPVLQVLSFWKWILSVAICTVRKHSACKVTVQIPLLENVLSSTSYLTIRFWARDFYEVIVDEAEVRINYHLIEIESE